MATESLDTEYDVLFIGGTGRSGTTVIGNLIGSHPSFAHPDFELKLHTDGKLGLPAVAAGGVDVELFAERLWSFWYRRPGTGGEDHGLHRHISDEEMETALARLRANAPQDGVEAARNLVRAIMEPIARERGASGWIDTTPSNAACAPFLLRMFPNLRLVHSVRNGLDAACSVMTRSWGPDGFMDALNWWEDGLRRSADAVNRLPQKQLLTVQFEDLVARDRRNTYKRLLAFLGLGDAVEMSEYFSRHMGLDRANIGRWRHQLDPKEHHRAEAAYQDALERLRADGITCLPRET